MAHRRRTVHVSAILAASEPSAAKSTRIEDAPFLLAERSSSTKPLGSGETWVIAIASSGLHGSGVEIASNLDDAAAHDRRVPRIPRIPLAEVANKARIADAVGSKFGLLRRRVPIGYPGDG
jgi:hypothetical protein